MTTGNIFLDQVKFKIPWKNFDTLFSLFAEKAFRHLFQL